jgi:hypothetical protein
MTTQSFYELLQKRAVSLLGLNPFPWYKHMRMTAPVSIDEQNQLTLTRFWGVEEEKYGKLNRGGFNGQISTNLYERIQTTSGKYI